MTIKNTYLTLFIIILQILFLSAQKSDSLASLYKIAQYDTTRCRLLSLIMEDVENDSVWEKYNAELLRITENNLKTCPASLRNYFSAYYALSLNNFGYIYTENGQSIKAIEFYDRAINIQARLGDRGSVASSLINLGFVFRREGNIAKAIENYHSALKIFIDLKNKNGMATCYNNIGFIFDNQQQSEKALEYYNKGLNAYSSINSKSGMATCYTNIAYVYKTYGDPDCITNDEACKKRGAVKAIRCLMKAIHFQKEIGDMDGLGNSYNMLGALYDIYGDPECNSLLKNCLEESKQKVFNYYTLALQLRQEAKSLDGTSNSYHSLASYMLKYNNFNEALKYGLLCLNSSRELNSIERIADAAFVLKNIYIKLNKPSESLKMFELYIQMRDSVNNHQTKELAIKKGFQIEYEIKATADSVKISEEKKVTTAQLRQEKTQRLALYGGIILVGLFGAFMFNRFKVSQKQNALIQLQKTELQEQKELIEEAQKETLDSIHYAKRIQTALIANSNFINEHIPNNFIYFNPKDIVSGDFYWASLHNNKFYLAICDSTGHGVPGAFMSLLNMGFLSEAIKEKNIEKPNEIFDYVRERLISTISNEGQKDGMDGILLCLDKKTNTMEYCAANNEPILIHNNSILELPKDKMPVGKGERLEEFKLHSIDLKPGDTLYLYTDGFADQFGGPKGKKFKYKQLNELLLSLNTIPLNEQKQILEQTFRSWKGNLEQVDDVLIAGIKI